MPQFPKDHQQWEPIILSSRKSATSSSSSTSSTAIRSAMNKGHAIESVERHRGQETAQRNRSLENDTETLGHATVSYDMKVALQRARQAKKMTQKELALAIQEKANVINEYESGRAIPNNQLIARMERVLGMRLPRAPKATKG